MLYRNDLFERDGITYRLLTADPASNTAWVIDVSDATSWPLEALYHELAEYEPVQISAASFSAPTKAAEKVRAQAWTRVQALLADHSDLFIPNRRNRAIAEAAAKLKCSPRTLAKDLRRYWQRGQNRDALLPDYCKCGRTVTGVTAGRGSTPKQGYAIFQVTDTDCVNFKEILERNGGYLKDERVTLTAAYKQLVNRHYSFIDGNGDRFVNTPGARPTVRQFRYYLDKHYRLETRLRGRKGNSEFELNHRARLNTTKNDCQGVGDKYEIDATIVDLYTVAEDDVRVIVGKATLYLVIDRKSNLVVGFYLGLEHPSWSGAMEAILSIAEDKAKLCAKYGVAYNPEDWPAHEIFPKEFLADRGDMISGSSDRVCDGLYITVTNLPPKRADWKPHVECEFKLVQASIKEVAPGYDPPANATRRQGKHYEKDACLNVTELGKILLEAVLKRNRSEMLDYELSLKEIADGIRPNPISIWNHNIRSQVGQLTRYTGEHVRLKLLPRRMAVVTDQGILLRGCYYSCPLALAGDWFVKARKKRFPLQIAYDSRLVDSIYVLDPDYTREPVRAELTPRSEKYRGISFAEVERYESLRKAIRNESEHSRLQHDINFINACEPTVSAAKKRLADAGKGVSRSARKEDTKAARSEELRKERQGRVMPRAPVALDTNVAAVIPIDRLPPARTATEDQPLRDGSVSPIQPLTRDELIQRARNRMRTH